MKVVTLLHGTKTKHTRTSSRTGLTHSLPFQLTFWMVLRSFRWRTGGETPSRTSDTRSGSAAGVFFFATNNQAFASNASPFLNEFRVYLGVEKLCGTWIFFFRMTTWHSFCFSPASQPAVRNFRNVFGTRDCNDVLHTLRVSYLIHKKQVSMIISTLRQKRSKTERNVMQKEFSSSNCVEASPWNKSVIAPYRAITIT